ncbi:hypothetical protein K435DRAFT_858835 [Dendrothele bispora CBS 962.96]|uniref:Uncharacterized protein n=1 Tax=Dendrothele bispora (strain CBS 962.96) TaxID=1314807 RepID=A0A4S8M224_DENBC|nr:hypothetical protein K435DRAFT_858835 [Dendrothele bispora CBS 962.96]
MLASDHPQPFSLYTGITSSRDSAVEDYPVSELIKTLIHYAGVEICSPTFQRFTLSSYEFISTARDTRDEINKLVAKVDSSSSEEDVWDDFDRYTGLIDPTEDALLKFLEIVEKESRWLSLNDDGAFASMENYQSWIKQWADNRMGLCRCLIQLTEHIEPQRSEDYVDSLLKQDTKAFMQYLRRRIKDAFKDITNAGKTVPPEGFKALESYENMINEFGRRPFNGETADRAAGAALVGSCKIDDARAKGYELPPTFFENLQTVFRAITDLLQKKDNASLTKVDEKIQGFRTDHITGKSGPIVDLGIIELLRLVRGVHRPFYGRASTLVKLFKEKAYVLGSKGPGSEYNKVHELVRTTITDSASSIRSLSLDIPEDQKASLKSKFNTAEQRITSKLDKKSCGEWQEKIKKAQELDESHMKRFREAAKAYSQKAWHFPFYHPQNMKSIAVTVLRDKKNIKEFDCQMNTDMRMTTFLWHIATNCMKDRDQVMKNPIFKNNSGKVIDMDLDLKDPIVGQKVILEI